MLRNTVKESLAAKNGTIVDEFGFWRQSQIKAEFLFERKEDELTAPANALEIPTLIPPRIVTGSEPLRFYEALETYQQYTVLENMRNYEPRTAVSNNKTVAEAISTQTTGAVLGVYNPDIAIVALTNKPAFLRDTTIFCPLPQGYGNPRFGLTSQPAATALSENIQGPITDPTLSTINVTTSERGVPQAISYRAERQIQGPILNSMILGDRIEEIADEDRLVLGSGGSGGLEAAAASVPAASRFNGDGTAYTNDASVTTGMTFTAKALFSGVKAITSNGYDESDIVCVVSPKQFLDLQQDSNLVRYMDYRTASSGVIPNLGGVEIRRSTLLQTGTGQSAQTVWHAWLYKKNVSIAMAASQDVTIYTFRNTLLRQIQIQAMWIMGANVLDPNSVAEIVSS